MSNEKGPFIRNMIIAILIVIAVIIAGYAVAESKTVNNNHTSGYDEYQVINDEYGDIDDNGSDIINDPNT